jgi:hypothetical protein
MKRWLRKLLLRLEASLRPLPQPIDLTPVVRTLGDQLSDYRMLADWERRSHVEHLHEIAESRQMQGSGPWLEHSGEDTVARARRLKESVNVSAQGSMGDLELAIQNVEWRREVNLSWLEFSRWGIQQIILISRLYYIKNPIVRRLINVDAYYVFGRGVEISSTDRATNEAIKEYLAANQSELGQTALSEHQKRTNYDGNLFFVFFPDTQDTGAVPLRTIDATEIMDIVTNPDDTTEEWYFRRVFTFREFDPGTGATMTRGEECWYPALGYLPKEKPEFINGKPVMWDNPVLHRKYGTVGKWLFGCPRIYPALDWAKAARRYLEACATLAQALSQYAVTITTKGGQQALAGIKQQLETTVGPNTAIWDQNPTAVTGSVFGSGPGTKLEAFHSRGQGLDPSEVKQFAAMCAICMDVPPTFLGDLETANLATATSLDRPTELAFMHKQEEWREVLVQILTYALNVQLRAPGGKLREAFERKHPGVDMAKVRIIEAPRNPVPVGPLDGRVRWETYMSEAQRKQKGIPKKDTDIEITVVFPSIREGDAAALVSATVEAMTLANKGGQIVGIDEKAGVLKLFELLGIDNGKEVVEEMYPSTGKDKYDPNRTKEDAAAIAPPISSRPPFSPGGPQDPGGHQQAPPKVPVPANEALTPGQQSLARLGWSLDRVRRLLEKKSAA